MATVVSSRSVLLAGLALALSGCASFDSLLAKSRRSEAQQLLSTEDELRRLVTAYDAGSILVHVRRVDRTRALRELEALEHAPETLRRFGELLDRTTYFTLVAGRSATGLELRWRLQGGDIQFAAPWTSASSLADVTGEVPPADCHAELRDPSFPTLGRVMNPLLKKLSPLPTIADKPYTVTTCPSKYEEVRTAPLAAGLNMALDTRTHAKEVGLRPDLADTNGFAVGATPALADARVALCAYERGAADSTQLALRYEAPLHAIETFFAGASATRSVPLGRAPFTRSVVFVSQDRLLVEGGDGAVDCLYEPFDSPLAKRIVALKLARKQPRAGAPTPAP